MGGGRAAGRRSRKQESACHHRAERPRDAKERVEIAKPFLAHPPRNRAAPGPRHQPPRAERSIGHRLPSQQGNAGRALRRGRRAVRPVGRQLSARTGATGKSRDGTASERPRQRRYPSPALGRVGDAIVLSGALLPRSQPYAAGRICRRSRAVAPSGPVESSASFRSRIAGRCTRGSGRVRRSGGCLEEAPATGRFQSVSACRLGALLRAARIGGDRGVAGARSRSPNTCCACWHTRA